MSPTSASEPRAPRRNTPRRHRLRGGVRGHDRRGLRRRAALSRLLPGHRLRRRGAARRAAPTTVLAQTVTVSFDTNVRGLPGTSSRRSQPDAARRRDRAGLLHRHQHSRQAADRPRRLQRRARTRPGPTSRKLQCFCFNDQTIPAHTTVKFPVLYFIDPGFAVGPRHQGLHRTLSCPTPSSRPPKPAQALGGERGGKAIALASSRLAPRSITRVRGLEKTPTWPTPPSSTTTTWSIRAPGR